MLINIILTAVALYLGVILFYCCHGLFASFVIGRASGLLSTQEAQNALLHGTLRTQSERWLTQTTAAAQAKLYEAEKLHGFPPFLY